MPNDSTSPEFGNYPRRRKYALRRAGYAMRPPLMGVSAEGLGELGQNDSGVASAAAKEASRQLTAAQERVAELEAKVAELEAAATEHETKARESAERAARACADVENQRRRHQKEKEDLRKFATEELMRDVVPVLDHFDLAMQSMDSATEVASVRQGIVMIHRELLGLLKSNGLEQITQPGGQFDPNIHEAVGTLSDPTAEDGAVSDVLRAGWILRGRILRPAMVRVNKLEVTPSPSGNSIPKAAFDAALESRLEDGTEEQSS